MYNLKKLEGYILSVLPNNDGDHGPNGELFDVCQLSTLGHGLSEKFKEMDSLSASALTEEYGNLHLKTLAEEAKNTNSDLFIPPLVELFLVAVCLGSDESAWRDFY